MWIKTTEDKLYNCDHFLRIHVKRNEKLFIKDREVVIEKTTYTYSIKAIISGISDEIAIGEYTSQEQSISVLNSIIGSIANGSTVFIMPK